MAYADTEDGFVVVKILAGCIEIGSASLTCKNVENASVKVRFDDRGEYLSSINKSIKGDAN